MSRVREIYNKQNDNRPTNDFGVEELRIRNRNLFNLQDLCAIIVGCGAIGSFTASTLARMGVSDFVLYDGDHVAPENIGVQDFTYHQLGQTKVSAVKQNIYSINPTSNVHENQQYVETDNAHGRPFRIAVYNVRPSSENFVIVMALDSMEARKKVAKVIDLNGNDEKRIYQALVIDPRMGSETFQLNKFVKFDYDNYMKTWYSDEEGDSEPCAARATAYCSTFAGSIIASEIKKHFTKNLSADEILFNFPNLVLDSKTDFSQLQK